MKCRKCGNECLDVGFGHCIECASQGKKKICEVCGKIILIDEICTHNNGGVSLDTKA